MEYWINIFNSADWKTILGVITTIVIAYIQYRFSRRLEKQKTELQEVTEKIRHENQRRLTDFNLYATKKHERFIKLYEKLSLAHNQVLWQTNPLRQLPSFTDYNIDDMVEHLKTFNITRAFTEELLNSWKNNPKEGTKKIHDMMLRYENVETNNAIREAYKAYNKAQLYLSRTLLNEIDDNYLEKINKLAGLVYRDNADGLSNEERINLSAQEELLKKHVENTFPEIVQKLQCALREDPFESEQIH